MPYRHAAGRLLVALSLGLIVHAAGAPPANSFNSEEHKILGELAAAGLVIPGFLPDAFPLGVAFFEIDKADDLAAYTAAKLFAVGFATNEPEFDYSEDLKKVQDNSYWNGYAQRGSLDAPYEGNLWLWIPPEDYLVTRRLELAMPEAPGERMTFGQLLSFYGDYRKVPYCNDGACYITNADTPTTSFEAGSNWFLNPFDTGWRPDPLPTATYVQYIASGLWPPYGSGGNTVSNTADDDEYEEAGWWGDELLRNAAINDWHFATAALSWYVGMHRLALKYAQMAAADPKHWAAAMHYEANAAHSFTDLFAFGHMVTHRDASSYGIVEEEGGLVDGETFQWMQAVTRMGGATRVASSCKGLGGYTCRRWQYPDGAIALPDLDEPPHGRLDFVPAYAPGAWTNWTLKEKRYHSAFNDAGACVRNLRGEAFYTYGDSHLRFMTAGDVPVQSALCGVGTRDGISVIAEGVRASLKTLFDAYAAAAAGVPYDDSPGAPAFEALQFLPAYIISNTKKATTALAGIAFDYGAGHFTGRWVTYAGAMEALAGTKTLPSGWNGCAIPYIDGGESLPPQDSPTCAPFPLVVTPSAATVVAGATVAFMAAGGSDATAFPEEPGYQWTLLTNASGGTIDAQTGVYTAGPSGGVDDVVQVTDGDGATVTVAVNVLAASGVETVEAVEPVEASPEASPEPVEPAPEAVEPVAERPADAGPSDAWVGEIFGDFADPGNQTGGAPSEGCAAGLGGDPRDLWPVVWMVGLLFFVLRHRYRRDVSEGEAS